jgi:hypothetical protein
MNDPPKYAVDHISIEILFLFSVFLIDIIIPSACANDFSANIRDLSAQTADLWGSFRNTPCGVSQILGI